MIAEVLKKDTFNVTATIINNTNLQPCKHASILLLCTCHIAHSALEQSTINQGTSIKLYKKTAANDGLLLRLRGYYWVPLVVYLYVSSTFLRVLFGFQGCNTVLFCCMHFPSVNHHCTVVSVTREIVLGRVYIQVKILMDAFNSHDGY